MGFFDLDYFKLEKKTDGLYRCKGGSLADIILLSSGIIYCFVLWIFSPIIRLFRKEDFPELTKALKHIYGKKNKK